MTDYTVTLTESGGTISGSISPSTTGGGVNNNAWDVSPNDRVRWTNSTGISAADVTISMPSGFFTSNTQLTVGSSTTTGYKTVASGTASNQQVVYAALDETTFTFYGGSNYFDKVAAGTIAPTDITFGSDPGTASGTVAITATASGGTGGTMKVSENGTTWVANGSSFNFTRGTAKTIYARTEGTSSNSSNYTESFTASYLAPASVTATSSSIQNSATSASTTINSTVSGETYAVRENNGATNLATRTGNGILTWTSSLPASGSSKTYEIFGNRPTSTGGSGSFVQTNVTFTVTRTNSTYSLSAPTSINEGTSGTVSVTTTNAANSTLYWGVEPISDFSTSTGTVSISSNSGSFSVTPTSDSTTEGAETGTVRLYTDSARTIEVASDTFTINDTSTAAGSGYGLQVYNSSGQLSIEISDRILNQETISVSSATTAANSSTNVTIPDVGDDTKMNYAVVPTTTNNTSVSYSASGNTLTVSNTNSTLSFSFNVFAFRIG